MARALASVINVLDPDVIVLGRRPLEYRSVYDHVPALWAPHVFSVAWPRALVRAKHGDSSGVRGGCMAVELIQNSAGPLASRISTLIERSVR